MSDDYYELLGVDREVDAGELKKAYRKAAMQCHPDRNPGDAEAEERFKAISEAYEVLSDPQKRRIYDRYGKDGLRNQGFSGFSDIGDVFSQFGDLFGDLFGFGRRARARGADLQMRMVLTLEDCLRGLEREVEFNREVECDTCRGSGAKAGTTPENCRTCGGRGQVAVSRGFISMTTTCPSCHGAGKTIRDPCGSCRGSGRQRKAEKVTVKIPPGIDQGMKLRLTGKGEGGPPGGAPGDLFVVIEVENHARFERHGSELLAELPIDMVQACLGDEIEFETLDGAETVSLAAGTQPGTVLRLRGKGMPSVEGRRRGDLHLRVAVRIPTALNDAQAELLRRFRDATTP
ncbi:MAG: molecular chaperone DnaJ [Myxococcales bacterium]|nr:molecular chaperone DnaJ [Myxococcales bacterium]